MPLHFWQFPGCVLMTFLGNLFLSSFKTYFKVKVKGKGKRNRTEKQLLIAIQI